MNAAGFVLFSALLLTAAIAIPTDHADRIRLKRGVRGGEGDNSVVVEAAENDRNMQTRRPACPRGEVFSTCGTACPRTCLSLQRGPKACPNICAVGCFCKEGMVRDYSGACIKESQC